MRNVEPRARRAWLLWTVALALLGAYLSARELWSGTAKRSSSEVQAARTAIDRRGTANRDAAMRGSATPHDLGRDRLTPVVQARGLALEVVVLAAPARSPVSGALVELGGSVQRGTETDEGGSARFASLLPGSYRIQVTADGFAPRYAVVSLSARESEQRREVILEQGGFASGTVSDPDSRPIASARVIAVPVDDALARLNGYASVLSDERGAWSFAALGPGRYRFEALHDLFAPGTSAVLQVAAARPLRGVQLQLQRGAAIAGRVVDSRGLGVEDAKVRVALAAGSSAFSRAHACDSAGRFRIEGLPRAVLHVTATTPDASSPVTTADLTRTRDALQLTLLVTSDESIEGHVYASDGSRIAGAFVAALPESDKRELEAAVAGLSGLASATSDAAGAFRLTRLKPGQYRLRASRTATHLSGEFWSTPGTPALAGDKAVRLTVDDAGAIAGSVTTDDGTAPPEYAVALSSAAPQRFDAPQFRVGDVPPGTQRVTLSAPGFVSATLRDVKVDAGRTTELGAIVLKRGATIRGKVLTAQAEPVAGARVIASPLLVAQGERVEPWSLDTFAAPQMTQSGADGSYELRGIDEASLVVAADEARHGRSKPVSIVRPAASITVDLTLLAGERLTGSVLRDGIPVPQALVVATPRDTPRARYSGSTGVDGTYALAGIPPGSYVVSAVQRTGSYTSASVAAQVELPSNARQNLEFRTGSVALTVRALRNGTPQNAQIYLSSGGVSALTAGELERALNERGEGVTYIGTALESAPCQLSGVLAGQYTLCGIFLPPTAASGDARASAGKPVEAMPAVCTPVAVGAAPQQQIELRQVQVEG
jgi:protocatechuate 3,4-dioxygenase beta subunit